MAKQPSLFHQARMELEGKFAFGQSKHKAKETGDNVNWIYSHSTATNYFTVSKQFTDWCKENHGIKNLTDARALAPDYLNHRISSGKAASTIARDAAALGKLFGCSKKDFGVDYPKRHREDFTRSRNANTVRSKHFNPANHKGLDDFTKATGLRRAELSKLKLEDITFKDGKAIVNIVGNNAKGGRVRWVEALDPEAVARACELAKDNPSGLVFGRLPSHMDIHANRALFAEALYKLHARDISTLSRGEKYICRADKLGTVYDRRAMAIVSKALGHNRLNVIAQSYLGKVYK